MDRERLGRALGKGARAAARTALEAVDAATAPDPRGASQVARGATGPRRPDPPATVRAPSLTATLRSTAAGMRGSSLVPLRKASRALWYEVTGSFFALFALSFGVGLWHLRALARSADPGQRHRFVAFACLAALFLYFAGSSFVRAHRINRAAL